MAEISSLLGLITDDNTRQALIAQMENMFDNAPDEERLIQEIGNPTKVAVALIRYADSGKITPAAAPVVAPEQVQPKRAPQPRPRAEQYRPAAAAAAQTPASAMSFQGIPEEPAAAPVLDGQFSFDEQPEEGYYDEQPADDGYYDEQPTDDGYYDEQPAGDDGYYDEQPEGDYDDPNYATDGEEGYYDEAYYEDEPAYKTNVFLAILYTLGAIVIGVPVLAVLLGADVEAVTGRGGGITEESFRKKKAVIRTAIEVNRTDRDDVVGVLSKVGGFDLAAMCGAFLGAAAARRPAVIDGLISAAAALCAVRLSPNVHGYLVPSHASFEIGYRLAMEAMDLRPLFDLGMRLGEGSGCPLAFQVLDAACAVINDMATFDEAGINDDYLDEIRRGDQFTP